MPVDGEGSARIYRMLAYMAWCDVRLPAEERAWLEAWREGFGLSAAEADQLEADGKGGHALVFGRDAEEVQLLVDSLIDVAVADGRLALREQWRLLSLAKSLGLPEKELVDRLADRVRERGLSLVIET